ncbi:uncharacterized protein LOC134772142 [Penaeus indicus]|uniref:uncharacterized protein LOC134772142 n=1 Tax=Penaeus indicus TaxID=29960 RepID=UPI00300CC682
MSAEEGLFPIFLDLPVEDMDGTIEKPIFEASEEDNNVKDNVPNDAAKSFQCSECRETFTRKTNLKRHHQRKHKDTSMEDDSSVSKSKCLHPTCEKLFYHKSKMMNHMEEEHEVKSSSSQHSFPSEKEFLEWKEKEEITNNVYYSKQPGDTEGKSTKYRYYICQQDGSAQPHRAHDQPARKTDRKNAKGQIKTGTTCPSRMSVRTSTATGMIEVTYMRTHSHEPTFKDTAHHPIPASIRTDIENKIALGIPITQIRRDLHGGIGERDNRSDATSIGQLRAYQFVSKHIMHEMHRKLNANARLHPQDSMATYLLLNKLEKEKYNPVLVYKPQGDGVFIGDPAIGDLPHAKDLFAIGIQTKEQLDMMHNQEILCIDATHGTNQYGYSLTNLLVPDEWGKGYPVGHLISNYLDEKTLFYFFQEIKKRDPNLTVNVIMSDDDYSGPNAIKAVFGQDIRHLLCKWHVHRAWQWKLKHHIATDSTLRDEIYKCLIVILEEKNTNKFKELTAAFEKKYTPTCESFVKYFFSNYMNRPEAWAMCYRQFPHANTDTNMFAEAFHNRLKTFFMKRQPNRRVDDLVNLLLEIEEEDFWRRKSDLQYKSTAPPPLIPHQSRHRKDLQIEDKDVEHVEYGVWRVKSQSKAEVWYKVTSIERSCDQDHCFERCQELACLGLCSHLYHCTCDDKSLLCKHIHKIHAFTTQIAKSNQKEEGIRNDMNDGDDDPEGFPLTMTTLIEPDSTEPTPPRRMLDDTKRDVERLQEMLENEDVVKAFLPHISGTLMRLLSQCSAVYSSRSTAQPQPMEPTQTIAPNAKLQLQLQPMKKALKRKAAPPSFTGPTAAERRELMKSLLPEDKDAECDGSTCQDPTPTAARYK